MILARWDIDARFGHRDAALALLREWWREIAPQVGWTPDQVRVSSGSLGVAESRLEVEVRLADLAELNDAWTRLANARGQEEWARALDEHIVSGTPRWRIYRLEPTAEAG